MAVEDRQQSPCAQIVADQECREPRDAKSRQRRVAQGLRVGRAESAVDYHRAYLLVDIEAPFDRSAAVNEGKTTMLGELVDILRHAAAFQIGRRRAGDEAMTREQSCHQATIVAAAEPDRKISAFVDQIDIAVVEGDADQKLRPFVHELVQDRQYMQPAERHR